MPETKTATSQQAADNLTRLFKMINLGGGGENTAQW